MRKPVHWTRQISRPPRRSPVSARSGRSCRWTMPNPCRKRSNLPERPRPPRPRPSSGAINPTTVAATPAQRRAGPVPVPAAVATKTMPPGRPPTRWRRRLAEAQRVHRGRKNQLARN
uniref:(northern house mosquito) hypothetical protein n=1 Tax=Culex pipiens TaxID=7175 RepID=A0A8D8FPP6_CULPI